MAGDAPEINVAETKQNWGFIALAAAAAFVVYKFFSAASAVGGAITSAGQAIGSGLFDFFNPSAGGVQTIYNVQFSNGQKHAIAANTIEADGTFTVPPYVVAYAGQTLKIVTDQNGFHFALPP